MSEQASDQVPVKNPFLLMMHPEVVIAAMEKSERLAALNRHTCRPLDRVLPIAEPENARADSSMSKPVDD
jgi:hypothetical protein